MKERRAPTVKLSTRAIIVAVLVAQLLITIFTAARVIQASSERQQLSVSTANIYAVVCPNQTIITDPDGRKCRAAAKQAQAASARVVTKLFAALCRIEKSLGVTGPECKEGS